jgi:hypothetical protein
MNDDVGTLVFVLACKEGLTPLGSTAHAVCEATSSWATTLHAWTAAARSSFVTDNFLVVDNAYLVGLFLAALQY